VAGEGAAVGALGLELGFGSLGAGSFGLGERVCRGELGLVVLAEGVTFAGSVSTGLGCLTAGVFLGLAGAADLGVGSVPGLRSGGDRVVALAGAVAGGGACGGCLLVSAGLDGGDLRAGVAAQLGEPGGCGARGVRGLLGGGLCGGGVGAGGSEGLGEGVCFLAGFGGLRGGGDGGGLGAAAGCFGFGDLGADSGGVQAGGLLAGGSDQDGGLPDEGVQGSDRVGVAGGDCGRGGDAGVVVVAAGAVVAAELPGAAAAGRGQGLAAAGAPADDGCRLIGGGLAGHAGAFLRRRPGAGFLFISFLF
jgi:hypothetical protein